MDDLSKKIDYYLTHQEERNKIAKKGQKTPENEQTVESSKEEQK